MASTKYNATVVDRIVRAAVAIEGTAVDVVEENGEAAEVTGETVVDVAVAAVAREPLLEDPVELRSHRSVGETWVDSICKLLSASLRSDCTPYLCGVYRVFGRVSRTELRRLWSLHWHWTGYSQENDLKGLRGFFI